MPFAPLPAFPKKTSAFITVLESPAANREILNVYQCPSVPLSFTKKLSFYQCFATTEPGRLRAIRPSFNSLLGGPATNGSCSV
jgi:hypothetical protein